MQGDDKYMTDQVNALKAEVAALDERLKGDRAKAKADALSTMAPEITEVSLKDLRFSINGKPTCGWAKLEQSDLDKHIPTIHMTSSQAGSLLLYCELLMRDKSKRLPFGFKVSLHKDAWARSVAYILNVASTFWLQVNLPRVVDVMASSLPMDKSVVLMPLKAI